MFSFGVKGAAAATVISYGVAMLFSGIYVFTRQPELSIKKNDLKLNLKIFVGAA